MAPARRRVMLLFGGRSAEHDVSCVTAVAVARALDPERYEVVPIAITTEGEWLLAGEARAALEKGTHALPSAFAVEGEPVLPPSVPAHQEIVPASAAGDDGVDGLAPDVVLPLLHGPYGEDGTVQGLLELAGLAYVGSGVVGSAVGMDKVMMKRAFAAAGLPQARALARRDGVDHAADPGAFATRVVDELGLPAFVKPANMGSSVAVTKAHDRAELDAAIALAFDYDEWCIAEEAVSGREIEVGVLGDDPPEASVPGEIVPGDEFYSYADKYENGDAQLLVPAPLSADGTAEVRGLAVRAFEACRCEAMARVDFFYEDGPGGRGFLVNELNTIPGFTPISMYPKLWDASGVPYPELLDRLIDLAIARRDRRARRAGRQR
ncbi:MAG TPA: D-alanine--D-alanine ligase family protein [Acidimicrobiia bacterium]|jgi:D-alanine-D-alanine ligase|nr:D-alanine--D-alanine ligase family protein [Acidimicrobiia bacterium]